MACDPDNYINGARKLTARTKENIMKKYNVEEISARYKTENGRMYAGAYEWMIAEIQRLTPHKRSKSRRSENAASKVLRDKTNSKSAKTKAGSALTQPVRRGK